MDKHTMVDFWKRTKTIRVAVAISLAVIVSMLWGVGRG